MLTQFNNLKASFEPKGAADNTRISCSGLRSYSYAVYECCRTKSTASSTIYVCTVTFHHSRYGDVRPRGRPISFVGERGLRFAYKKRSTRGFLMSALSKLTEVEKQR